MGGDFGPRTTIQASLEALDRHPNLKLVLVGDLQTLTEILSGRTHSRLSLKHASSVIASDSRVKSALRDGADSSMQIALNLVSEGECGAALSAGNTGALMALSRRTLGMIEGIERPAITAAVPTLNGQCQVLDLGANIDSTSDMLVQYAVLGRALVRVEQGVEPRVGLLNVGSEESKGNETLRDASAAIAELPDVKYVGFVEGSDLYSGEADLIVCDGMAGNVALKSSEGVARLIRQRIHQGFSSSLYRRVIAWLAKPILKELSGQLSVGSRNGALFLGLNGLVVKSHGGVQSKQFGAAIDRTLDALQKDLISQIKNDVSQYLASRS